jgi:hypothetical protein
VTFHTRDIAIATRGKGLSPFTREAARWVASTDVGDGLLTVFIRHTSASLVIQENADPGLYVFEHAARVRRAQRDAAARRLGTRRDAVYRVSGISVTWT